MENARSRPINFDLADMSVPPIKRQEDPGHLKVQLQGTKLTQQLQGIKTIRVKTTITLLKGCGFHYVCERFRNGYLAAASRDSQMPENFETGLRK
ncbi:hypothetical protein PanWU01x14_072050 [Parasponia andersonii]|uniref:Uncharacterized protein n=1 Tax=Parasponia andersonii TaxID=3476 RepID=A0A2P5DDN4_PARAD|nr:hypothetical protein PanWU01x14_072050 [Parasponia andersonii]